jgi:ATP-dependent DNA helicase RecG
MPFEPSQKLQTPIEYLKGVGPIRAQFLKKELGIATFGDLLFFFPFRYEDKSNLKKINEVIDQENVLIRGQIVEFEEIGVGRKKRLIAYLEDGTGTMELVWFRSIAWIKKTLSHAMEVQVYGKASYFNRRFSITHPELEKIGEESNAQEFPLFPIYPSTEKLKAKHINGKVFAKLMASLLQQILPQDIIENLPNPITTELSFIPRLTALQQIHFPENEEMLHAATERLKFEELFIDQMNICKLKMNRSKTRGHLFGKVGEYFNDFYKNDLPFDLTDDQKQVLKEIRQDTNTSFQMNRLLQGDVGSGKTIVALLAMLLAKDNDFQACLIAPTEILAQQHFASLKRMLYAQDIKIALLTGSTKAAERKLILPDLRDGNLDILIGTHALLEPKVIFNNLGLCIIDEQHRFGVAQRAKMWQKNSTPPHILVMTATPIPRTLAMTAYGDLEVSVIKKLPPGRKPIRTVHRTDSKRSEVMHFIKSEIEKGHQIYIVYPLIEESAKLDYENLEQGYELITTYFPSHTYKVAMVHGRQSLEEREHNMQGFIKGEAQILVATTVIEVGVDVPNASVMIIESSERFGLAQLHQLRGRVGRGAAASYCILLTGKKVSKDGKERISTMVNYSSGFDISQKDLELRGPGDMHGTKQSGILQYKLANIMEDSHLMTTAREYALKILNEDAQLVHPENSGLKNYLAGNKGSTNWLEIS